MRLLTTLVCGLMSAAVVADDRFYSTVDAQGRVQIIKNENADAKSKIATPIPEKKEAVLPQQPPSNQQLTAPKFDGKRQLDSETYIDTELLEQKNFNLDDKKRFYYLPDGGLGTRVVESQEGVVTTPVSVSTTVKVELNISTEYILLSKKDIQDDYPELSSCLKKTVIKKNSKPFNTVNRIWVQPSLTPNKLESDGFLQLPTPQVVDKQLRVASFASTHKKPTFYLPVVVFLDDNGCALSGAWHYWSRAREATDTQYSSVEGLVIMPKDSAFVLFYRPINTLKADIPLSREFGSFVVEAY